MIAYIFAAVIYVSAMCVWQYSTTYLYAILATILVVWQATLDFLKYIHYVNKFKIKEDEDEI